MKKEISEAKISETEVPALIAYRVSAINMRLVPAPRARDWMQSTRDHFANRCLPLLVANQAGWFALNSHRFRAVWNGGEEPTDTRIEYLSGKPPYAAGTFRIFSGPRRDTISSPGGPRTCPRTGCMRSKGWSKPTGLWRPSQ